MGAEGHQIDLERAQVDGHLAGGLGGIDVEDDVLLATQLTQLGDRLYHADFIIHRHHRGNDGVGAQRRAELFQRDQAVLARVEIGHFEALTLQLAYGIEHRLVLGGQGDEVLAAPGIEVRRALDGQVVGFGGSRGPDDVLGIGADQCRHLGTRLFDGGIGFPAEAVRTAGRIAELLDQIGNHFLRHARIDRRGRRIIEINGQLEHAGSPG